MPAVFNAPKKIERKPFERKRSQQFKKTRKVRKMEFETKPKNQKWSLFGEDFVVNVLGNDTKNSRNNNGHPKRRLSTDDEEWELPSNRRRLKLQSNHNPSMYDHNDSTDAFDDGDISHVVPDWKITGDDSCGQTASDTDDALSSKSSEVQIVTIDEVIQFDSLGSASGFGLDEPTICFDIRKLIATEKESNELDLKKDKPDNALNVLLAFTNNSQIVFYDDDKDSNKEADNIEQYCNDCWEVENCKDQWQDDCQLEKFKFARCFKCRQKVRLMVC